MNTSLLKLTAYMDDLLNHSQIKDWDGAKNGLQLENNGVVTNLAAAVDANSLTIKAAIRQKIDLLIVHHGLFWNPIIPLTGLSYRLIKVALEANLAIYSSHLPLDAHPQIGNNILLTQALGLKNSKPFFEEKGTLIGRKIKTTMNRSLLVKRLETIVKTKCLVISAGPEKIRNVGIITGGAGDSIIRMAQEGIDTLITGEGSHWNFGKAYDLKVNLILAGHYATETFGVRALTTHLSKKFRLPWQFIDCPSGL